ncbi:hypothetical protein [Listeria booriae]|uniref:Uncharacterized protein n=1 Tax=Listeria booriae TaxID=1552123 RepID=A0A841XW57_9LIST|nr:hypothetical protein [Listeria booriae]MBC1316913.1 hypothetical protein [Listeria booriae]
MGNVINLLYIDDKIDSLISRYLDNFKFEDVELKFSNLKFKNMNDYEELLEQKVVQVADIIIIDSKLFEEVNAIQKFTGEEFKMIYTTVYPYSKVMVLSQNDDLERFGTIKKYSSVNTRSSRDVIWKDANKFYNGSLKEKLEECVKEILQKREILKRLKNNIENYEPSLIVSKINEMMEGTVTYKNLTDDKINELIILVEKSIKPQIKGVDSNGL